MDNHFSRRPAFGQVAAIGTLYDARNECFLSQSIFDKVLPVESVSKTILDKTTCEVIHNGTFEDNFKLMGISDVFGASILAGFVVLGGAGRMLDEKIDSRHILSAAIHHQILTVSERLNPASSGVNECRAPLPTGNNDATHIVMAIEWGAQSAVLARSQLVTSKVRFQAQVEALQEAVETGHPIVQGNPAWLGDGETKVDVMAFSDILDDGILMSDSQKFEEAYEFLSLIPTYIKHENSGKGNPIFYTLLPIPLLNLFLRTETVENNICIQPSQELLMDFVKIFDGFDLYRQRWNDYQAFLMAHKWCVPESHIRSIASQRQKLENAKTALQTKYTRALVDVRKGHSRLETFRVLLDEFARGSSSPREIANFDVTQQTKLRFIDKMVESGATYIGYNGLDLNSEIMRHKDGEVYILFFSSLAKGDQQSWVSNQALLLELLQKTRPDCFIAIFDCDAIGTRLEKAYIRHYENGSEVATDLVEEQHFMADKCFARHSQVGMETKEILKPVRRRFVKIACPGQNCDKSEVCEWLCPQCMAPIEFGYSDQFFYCQCGRNSFKNYDFRCKGSNHGPRYEKYDPNILNGLLQSLDQSNYQNILILGETGVGKSTFINAFVNYLTFDTLEDAKQHDDLTWVIPCSFSTQTMDREGPDGEIVETEIKVGSRTDENDGSKGASATQQTIVHSVEAGAATTAI